MTGAFSESEVFSVDELYGLSAEEQAWQAVDQSKPVFPTKRNLKNVSRHHGRCAPDPIGQRCWL